MLALKQKSKYKVSWAPLYYIMSLILSTAQLNYFSGTHDNAIWKKVLMIAILLLHMFVGNTCLAGLILPNNYDLEDTVSCLIIFITQASVGLKVIILIYHSVSLKRLSDVILKETSRDDFEPWEIPIAKRYYMLAKWMCIKVIFLYTLTLLSFVILPLFSSKAYMMPLLIELPGTNRTGHPGYEINYLFGANSVFYGTTIQMGFDIPAFLQACFICFQFDRCIHYCNMLGDFDTEFNTQEKQRRLLKNCIQLHADIFSFINQVAVLNTSVVALLVTTTVPLLTVLLYTVLLGTVSAAPVMMVTAVCHLFLYCFLGEIVDVKCQEASKAIYTSQWYRIENADDKRTLLFFLKVSQCDMRFSAGGLYKLSLETFTELMKRAYGAYAFLSEVL